MLSTQYRLRLEFICKKIANNEEVKLEDMIWAEKLAKAHTCLLYTSPSPRDKRQSRMPSSA